MRFKGVLVLFLLLVNISLAVPMECKVLSASQRLGDSVVQNVYLEAGDDDELDGGTILLRTQRNNVYISYDGGLVFNQIELRDKGRIIDIIVNKYFPTYIYLMTVDGYIYISSNGAVSFKRVKAPSKRSFDFALMKNPLSFHKYDPKKFIYAGVKGCHFWNNVADCRTVSFVTEDSGDSFTPLLENTRFCFFAAKSIVSDPNVVFCEQYYANGETPPNPRLLVSSDYFKSDRREVLPNTLQPTETAHALVAPTIVENSSLAALISFDGSKFTELMFPPELGFDGSWAGATCKVFEGKQTEHPMFFHLKRSVASKYLYLFYGALFKSNIEDGYYTLVSDYVNGDRRGVDFELISGLKGTALINIVINHEAIESGSVNQKSTEIKTKITHDDGSSWSYITPPPLDLEGNEFTCKGEERSLEDCSLNFKGPTERRSIEIESSCDSGKGLLFGLGNVGKYLDRDPSNLALYFSKDGGVSWREVAKGDYLWAFGDQGKVLVTVEISKKVDTLHYSLDEGETWLDYKFTDKKINVYDLVYLSSGSSRKFIVLENEHSVPDRGTNIRNLYTIGFSNDDNDSEFWSPRSAFGGVQYNDKHGTLFTLLSVAIIGGAWFVYNRGIKRNGGFSRLNSFAGQNVESSSRPIEENNTDKVVNCIVRVFFSTYQLFKRSSSTVFKELLPNKGSSSQDDVDQSFLGNQMDSERN